MSKRIPFLASGSFLALGLMALTLFTARAVGNDTATSVWVTDTFFDFRQGAMDGVDVWRVPGTIQLDRDWWSNVRVNDSSAQSKYFPSVSFALTDTGGLSETVFMVVWADERAADHSPDIYFAHSTDGGQSWSSDVLVSDSCDPDDPPYLDCPALYGPDLTGRLQDESLWVVWYQDDLGPDDGNLYYAVSHDMGATWPTTGTVFSGPGKQHAPRIAPHPLSGYLYAVWEDERADDGDIFVARYNPDVDLTWGVPLKVSDATVGSEQSRPALAVDNNSNVFAAWQDARDNDDGEVCFSRWLSGTTWSAGSWSANVRLSDPAMDWAGTPDIVATPDGVLYTAWHQRVPTGPATYDFEIVVARSVDQGANWTSSIVHRLDGASASNAFYSSPSLGIDGGGRVYVAWLHSPDSQAATSNVLFSVSPDAGMHWTTPHALNRPGNSVDVSTLPSLFATFDGEVVVAWQDFREGASTQIYATGYPSDQYLTEGQYQATYDAGGIAAWRAITWTATLSPDAGLQIATRVLTATGASWTDWVTHVVSGEALTHPSASFIQYRAVFTSTGSNTVVLDAVSISYEQYRIYLPLVIRGS